MRNTFKAIIIFTLSLPVAAIAAPFECSKPIQETQGLIRAIETRYSQINSLYSEFIQQSLFIGLDRKEYSRGVVSFKRPGKMDWVYEQPEKQRFVSDGTNLWFYQPSLEQVTVGNFKNSFDSELPVTFLLGLGKLSDSFQLEKACETAEGISVQLLPKRADANLQSLTLLIKRADNSPVGARVVDIGGNETVILFVNTKFNEPIDDSQFNFEIPRGTDVIDQRGQSNLNEPPSVNESDLVTDSGSSMKERLAKQSANQAALNGKRKGNKKR